MFSRDKIPPPESRGDPALLSFEGPGSAGSGGCGGLSGLSVSPLCNWGEGADLINRPYPEGRSNTFADGSQRFTVQLVSARLSSGTHDAVGRENGNEISEG